MTVTAIKLLLWCLGHDCHSHQAVSFVSGTWQFGVWDMRKVNHQAVPLVSGTWHVSLVSGTRQCLRHEKGQPSSYFFGVWDMAVSEFLWCLVPDWIRV